MSGKFSPRPFVCTISLITLAMLFSSCGERPISPIGASDNAGPQIAKPQQRKTLNLAHMRLLTLNTPKALHKGHACSGEKIKLVKAGKGEKLDLCHEKLEIAEGTLAQDTNVSFAVVNDELVMVEIGPQVSFKAPATLTLSLKVVNLVDVDMHALTISRYDAATDEWNDIPSTLDDKQENISAAVAQAGRYALTWNDNDGGKNFIAWQGEHWGGRKEKAMKRDKGGRFAFHGHEMEIPPYALPTDKKMVITEIHQGNAQVDFGPSGWFNKPVKITVCFKELDLAGIDLNDLTITWYDPDTGEWIDVGGVVDVKGKKVYVEVWHFTQYSLAAR